MERVISNSGFMNKKMELVYYAKSIHVWWIESTASKYLNFNQKKKLMSYSVLYQNLKILIC